MRLVRKPSGMNENITPRSNWNVEKKDFEEGSSTPSSLFWLAEMKETKIEERNVTHINQLLTIIQRKHLQRREKIESAVRRGKTFSHSRTPYT